MRKSEKRLRLKLLAKECEVLAEEIGRLARRAEYGMMTEAERRRKCNKYAREYLQMASEVKGLVNPYVAAYIGHAFYRVALDLKYMGAKTKEAKPAKRTRNGYDIKRKVIKY